MMSSVIEVPFLPSDIDRLILGYLIDSKYNRASESLLQDSPFLVEYATLKQRGLVCPTTTCEGMSLLDILTDFFVERRRPRKLVKRSVQSRLSLAREQIQALHTQRYQQQQQPVTQAADLFSSVATVALQLSSAQLHQPPLSFNFQQQQPNSIDLSRQPVLFLPNPSGSIANGDSGEQAQIVLNARPSSSIESGTSADNVPAPAVPAVADQQQQQQQPHSEPADAETNEARNALQASTTHKKKSQPRKIVPATNPILNNPVHVQQRKLIDRIISSPDKFANSWEQAVMSKKLDTDIEKLKQLLDSDQTEQRDELADIFLSTFLDDDRLFDAILPPESTAPDLLIQTAAPVSTPAPGLSSQALASLACQRDRSLNDSEIEEANIVCDSEHIESILTELTSSPFQTPKKQNNELPVVSSAAVTSAASSTLSALAEPTTLDSGNQQSTAQTIDTWRTCLPSLHANPLQQQPQQSRHQKPLPAHIVASAAAAARLTSNNSSNMRFVDTMTEKKQQQQQWFEQQQQQLQRHEQQQHEQQQQQHEQQQQLLLQLEKQQQQHEQQQQQQQLQQRLSSNPSYMTTSCDLDESCCSEGETPETSAPQPPPALPPSPPPPRPTSPEACILDTYSGRTARRCHRLPMPSATPSSHTRQRRKSNSVDSTTASTPTTQYTTVGSTSNDSSPSPSSKASPDDVGESDSTSRKRVTLVKKTQKLGFVCHYCGHSFSQKHRLNRHLSVHQQIKVIAASAAALKSRTGSSASKKPKEELKRRVLSDLKGMDVGNFMNSLSSSK